MVINKEDVTNLRAGRDDAVSMLSVDAKEKAREEIEAQTSAFLESGGTVTKLKSAKADNKPNKFIYFNDLLVD